MAVVLMMSAALLVAADQWLKASIISWLPHGKTTSLGRVTIRMVLNARVHGRSVPRMRMMAMLWLAEAVVFVAMVQLGPLHDGLVAPVALGAALGGAASNLLDRMWRDGVVDFVDLGFWPVFNLADFAIVIGVLVAVSWI